MREQLIDFSIFEETSVVTEDKTKLPPGVLMRVKGKVSETDSLNGNKRRYPREVWDQALGEDSFQSRLKNRTMMGLLGHPTGVPDEKRVSHIVNNVYIEKAGKNSPVIGEIDILDNENGQIVASVFRAGGKFPVSSRGDGEVTRQGDEQVVKPGFVCETWDFVTNPSVVDAYPAMVESLKGGDNANLILTAVGNLVKSTTSKDVCLESYHLVKGLGVDSKPLMEKRDAIIADIKTVLGEKESKSCDDDESDAKKVDKDKEDKDKITPTPKEEHMDKMQELIEALKSLVDQGGFQNDASKLDEMKTNLTSLTEKTNELNEKLVEALSEKDEAQKDLNAAYELINEAKRVATDLRSQIADAQAQVNLDGELEENYNAAEQLAEAALKRAATSEANNRDLQDQLSAAEKLIDRMVERNKGSKVDAYKESQIAELPEAVQEQARKLAERCETTKDVDDVMESITALTESFTPLRRRTEALPGDNRNSLHETRRRHAPQARSKGGSLALKLAERIGGK